MKGDSVAGATPLIHLAKIGVAPEFSQFYNRIMVPAAVYREVVVRGRAKNLPEVVALDRLFDSGLLVQTRAPKIPADIPKGLGKGEREAIALARREGCDLLVDDGDAYLVARALGVRPRRTTAILLEGVKRGLWKVGRFQALLQQLAASGYFITADVYVTLLELAQGLEKSP